MRKLLTLCLLLVSSVASASEVTLQGGWQHTPNSNYSDDYELAVRYEVPLIWDLNIGVDYAYHAATYHADYGDFIGHSVLGDLIYYPKVNWKIKPYVLGGIGWSWWDFDRNGKLKDAGIQVDLGDALSKKVAIGIDYPLGNNWFINVEWMYFHAHVPKDSYYEADGSPSNVVGNDDRSGRVTVGQEETNLMIGIKKRF